jgi:hypothetical protein
LIRKKRRLGTTISGDIPGLGYLTLAGDLDSPDAGLLAASSAIARGYSSSGLRIG